MCECTVIQSYNYITRVNNRAQSSWHSCKSTTIDRVIS